MLYIPLTLLFFGMILFPASGFILDKKNLFSWHFIFILLASGLVSATLYHFAGSARELAHYRLEKRIEALGGMETILKTISGTREPDWWGWL